MAGLREAVKELSEHFQRQGTSSCVERLVLDEGTVAFNVRLDDGEGLTRIHAVYADPENYPSSSATVWCEDNNDMHNEGITGLSELFQDKAPLNIVLNKARKSYWKVILGCSE